MNKHATLQTRQRVIKLYATGVIAFTAIFGSITTLVLFLRQLNFS